MRTGEGTRRCRAVVWRRVFRWGRRNGAGRARLDVMLQNHLRLAEAFYYGEKRWRVRKLLGGLHAAAFACRYPVAVRLPSFRHYMTVVWRSLLYGDPNRSAKDEA